MARKSEVISPDVALPDSIWHVLSSKHAVPESEDCVAVRSLHQPASHLSNLTTELSLDRDHLSWSFAQLKVATAAVSMLLLEQGVERGTTLITWLPNGIEPVLLTWVTALLQLTLVPLDIDMLRQGRTSHLTQSINDLRPSTIVVPDPESAAHLESLLQLHGQTVPAKWIASGVAPSGWNSLNTVQSPFQGNVNWRGEKRLGQIKEVDQSYERTAMILFTSGTSTGKSKGCPLSVRNVLAGCVNHFGLTELSPCFLVLNEQRGKEFIVPAASFSPAQVLSVIENLPTKQLTMLCVPAQVRLLSAALADSRSKPSSFENVKRIMLGGDISTEDDLVQTRSVFKSAKVSTSHGMTEACGILGYLGTSIEALPTHRGILSAGRSIAPSNVRIVSNLDSQRRVLDRGEVGDLHVGGPCVISRYLDGVHPDMLYEDESGNWLITGDRALMDENGFIFFVGRTKDIIKKGGLSLSPAVAEAVLNQQSGVEFAVVVGIPHATWGEVMVAIIEPEKRHVHDNQRGQLLSLDRARIGSSVTDALGLDYALDQVLLLSDLGLDSWPLNATGKIMKLTLKQRLVAQAEHET